jgi:hypothetical protein
MGSGRAQVDRGHGGRKWRVPLHDYQHSEGNATAGVGPAAGLCAGGSNRSGATHRWTQRHTVGAEVERMFRRLSSSAGASSRAMTRLM